MDDPKNIDEWLESLLTAFETQHQSLFQCAILSENGMGFIMLMTRVSKAMKNTRDVRNLFTSVENLDSVDALVAVKALLKLQQHINNLDLCIFPSYKGLIKPEILAYAKIEIQLDLLKEKVKNLYERNYSAAASAINEINADLHQLNKQFFVEKVINADEYKIKALENINKHKPILEKHRNYNYIIANLILAVLTLGTALLAHKVTYGSFLFFNQTDSSYKVAALNQVIENAKLNSSNLQSSQFRAS